MFYWSFPLVPGQAQCDEVQFVKKPSPVIVTEGNSAIFCAKIKQKSFDKIYRIDWEVGGKIVSNSSNFTVSILKIVQ